MLLIAMQVLALLVLLSKYQYPQVALSKWEWALRWEPACQGEAHVGLFHEFLAPSQAAAEVAMEVAPCPWVAGVTQAEEAILTWMLQKISVDYWIMAICSLCICVHETGLGMLHDVPRDTARRGFVEQQHSCRTELMFSSAHVQQMLEVLLCRHW